MKIQCIIWFLIAGVVCESGHVCDLTEAESCLNALVYYELPAFPFYGDDSVKLNETCVNIDAYFTCLKYHLDNCVAKPGCDNNCTELIKNMFTFNENTGLKKLTKGLCDQKSQVRSSYLENNDCLEKNRDLFKTCHRDSFSMKSQTYSQIGNMQHAACYYIAWYHDCLLHATERCKAALPFMKYILYQLMSDSANEVCASIDLKFAAPPMPTSRTKHHATNCSTIIPCILITAVVCFCLNLLIQNFL